MDLEFKYLFSPIVINHLSLRNRIVMSPVGTNFATTRGEVTERLIDHYEARAKGGVGMIIVEGSWIHHSGLGFSGQLGAYDDALIPGLKRLAEAVKAHEVPCQSGVDG
jgi:2,4-dienoyl-CoA reductase-like NADH-dependent reductase (Old Yellow Enzyme family)